MNAEAWQRLSNPMGYGSKHHSALWKHAGGSIGAAGIHPVSWPDEPPYTTQLTIPRWNIHPTIAGHGGEIPAAYVRQLFPGWSKDEHARAALIHRDLQKQIDEEWQQAVSDAKARYGDGNGHMISGVYRDHFPERTKARLRGLAHLATAAGEASRAHYNATGGRRRYEEAVT